MVPNHEEIQDLRSEFLDRHRVKLHDFREAKVPPSFSQSGFEVATLFPCPHGVDFDNCEHVKETYIPALEALVKTKQVCARSTRSASATNTSITGSVHPAPIS